MEMSKSARERAQTIFDSKLYSSLLIAEYTEFVRNI
jgi:hypothetical protein